MRLVFVLPVLICVAAPAHAEGARESRYGPTSPRQQAATSAAAAPRPAPAPYDGPMLGWANKRQAPTAAPVSTPTAATRPAPVANWAGYQGAPAPVAYAPSPAPIAAPPPASLYSAPRPTPVTAARPATPQPQPQPLPVASAPTGPAPVKDWSNYRSARVLAASANAAAPAPAPAPTPTNLYAQPIARQPLATPTAPPPPQPRQVAAVNTGVTGARFYSVSREYGMTPDALPAAGADSRVLITASEPSPDAKDDTPLHGSADWLAAGVNGEDGDDEDSSAERRAKARKRAP